MSKTKKKSLAERVKHDPALLKKALSNTVLRAQLPDRYLTQAQLVMRRNRQANQALGDITNPLSGSTMSTVAKTLTDNQYAPQFAANDAAAAQTVAQRDQQQKWAAAYQAGIQGVSASGLNAQGVQNAASLAGLQQARAAHIAAIGTAAKEADARAAVDANARGAGLDGGGGAQRALATQAATNAADAQGATQAAAAGANGNAQAAFLHGLATAAAMHGGETQSAIGTAAQNQLTKLSTDRTALTAGAAADTTAKLLSLRGTERDSYLAQQGLASGIEKAKLDAKVDLAKIKSQGELNKQKMAFELALKQMGISADTAKQQADQQFSATQKDLDRQNAASIAAGHDSTSAANSKRSASKKSAATKSKYTPLQQQAVVNSVQKAATAAANMVKTGGISTSQMRQILEGTVKVKGLPNYNFSHGEVNAAMDLAIHGYISAPNVKFLHGYGIVLHDHGLRTKKPAGSFSWLPGGKH